MNTYFIEISEHDAYELFHLAIAEQDADAWREISDRYRSLMIAWARKWSLSGLSAEAPEDIADQALNRAWSALTPESFVKFSTLPGLLAYLRTCVIATGIDAARAEASRQRIRQKIEFACVPNPEEVVLDGLERSELWQLVLSLTETEQERIVLVESFMHEQPPRSIHGRHTDLFPDVEAVYRTKRNLLNRMQRSIRLQQLYQELELS